MKTLVRLHHALVFFAVISLVVYIYCINNISSKRYGAEYLFERLKNEWYLSSNPPYVATTEHSLLIMTNNCVSTPRVIMHTNRACKVAPWEIENGSYTLTSDTGIYFNNNGTSQCFIEGTLHNNGLSCLCKHNWHGDYCSIPDSVWYSDLYTSQTFNTSLIKPRFHKHKIIIQAVSFNMEFDMLDARFAESVNIVDVFLILESNYTAFGKPKPQYLLDALKQGYYNQTSCRIVYVFLNYFPTEARQNGWIADALRRNHISMHGLVRQLTGYRHDDLFVLSDADEIPSRESLMFLKFHDGYPEPIGIHYQSSMYGYFWQRSKVANIPCAVSVGILFHVLRLKAYSIRRGLKDINKKDSGLNQYLVSQRNKTVIKLWYIGNNTVSGGWHCSWCLSPTGIKNKLLSAQNGDFPRWGDYPEKTNLLYIEGLVRNGSWFDNKLKFTIRENILTGRSAPQYFLNNSAIYMHLLTNPYT